MADTAPANPNGNAAPVTEIMAHDKTGGSTRFSQRGVPVIAGINRVGLFALYMKEVRRFLKVQTQTIWAPAFTTLLFLVIFTIALGREGREVLGVPFATFVAPGLIAMAMMQNAFANSSFSLLSGKMQGTIIDLLMPPLSSVELMAGILAAAVTRAILVGCTVALAMALWPGVSLAVAHVWAVLWFDHQLHHRPAVVALGHVLLDREPCRRIPDSEPRQPVLLRHLGLPLWLPRRKRHRRG
jgi:ABC-2 type transport system permease protein